VRAECGGQCPVDVTRIEWRGTVPYCLSGRVGGEGADVIPQSSRVAWRNERNGMPYRRFHRVRGGAGWGAFLILILSTTLRDMRAHQLSQSQETKTRDELKCCFRGGVDRRAGSRWCSRAQHTPTRCSVFPSFGQGFATASQDAFSLEGRRFHRWIFPNGG